MLFFLFFFAGHYQSRYLVGSAFGSGDRNCILIEDPPYLPDWCLIWFTEYIQSIQTGCLELL